MVIVAGNTHLFEIVLAAGTVGGLPHLLHSGQQKPNQDGDDGDDNEQLDQGESPRASDSVSPRWSTNRLVCTRSACHE
jgi:hypothetical protein